MSVAETLKKPAPRFHWKCKHTWRRSAKNTAWCLLGCSIGDFGTILYFQLTGIPWPTLYICLLYTSPSPRDTLLSRMPSSA